MILVSSETHCPRTFSAPYVTQYAAATLTAFLFTLGGLFFHRWMVGHSEASPRVVFTLLLIAGLFVYVPTEQKVPPQSARGAVLWTLIGLATCSLLTWALCSLFQK